MSSYDNWKLATPEDDAEDRERFMRKLYGRRPYTFLNSRQDVLDDYYEECKAEAQAGRCDHDDGETDDE
jgi:hypothetical protein